MFRSAAAAWGVIPLLLGACLFGGGGTGLDHCEIRVRGVEKWQVSSEGADVAYRVAGRAGSAAVVWLVARNSSGGYVSGPAVEVGPGRFEAIVDLELTGVPQSFVAVLESAGHRCKADAKKP